MVIQRFLFYQTLRDQACWVNSLLWNFGLIIYDVTHHELFLKKKLLCVTMKNDQLIDSSYGWLLSVTTGFNQCLLLVL